MQANNIGVVPALTNFNAATQIYLGGNRLKSMPPLPKNVETLDVSFNDVCDMSSVMRFMACDRLCWWCVAASLALRTCTWPMRP